MMQYTLCLPQVQIGTSATYHVVRRIGKGGFGYVYLGSRSAFWRKDGKPSKV
jgi:serine/threonine protein kinase